MVQASDEHDYDDESDEEPWRDGLEIWHETCCSARIRVTKGVLLKIDTDADRQ